ncbi:hypothetical protein RIR_jg1275.t1 [Rhizophagus irregularis DAOM 181602=DAOM 197198]|nr:hypothetical protein RIR_jg1275.t1 [Rhizophagus irregularis DAOM 181602=DAOM 197198]
MITPNIHLSLHIVDCCHDYGPLYSFWCYSFERMNGLLGKYIYKSIHAAQIILGCHNYNLGCHNSFSLYIIYYIKCQNNLGCHN